MCSLCKETLLTNEKKHLFILLAEYLHSKLQKETMINYISCLHIFLSAVSQELYHSIKMSWSHSTRGSDKVKQKGSLFLSLYLDNM